MHTVLTMPSANSSPLKATALCASREGLMGPTAWMVRATAPVYTCSNGDRRSLIMTVTELLSIFDMTAASTSAVFITPASSMVQWTQASTWDSYLTPDKT